MSSSTGQAVEKQPNTDAQPRPPATEEAVREVLKEVESGLESLRTLYQQRQVMAARLTEREAELEQEARRLAAGQGELKKSSEAVDQLRRSVEESRREGEQAQLEVEKSRQRAS